MQKNKEKRTILILWLVAFIVFLNSCQLSTNNNQESDNLIEQENTSEYEPPIQMRNNSQKDPIFHGFSSDMTQDEGYKWLEYLVGNDENFVNKTKYYPGPTDAYGRRKSYQVPCFKMVLDGDIFLFEVEINTQYDLIDNFQTIIRKSIRRKPGTGNAPTNVDLISLHFSSQNSVPIEKLINLYSKAYGTYNIEHQTQDNFFSLDNLPSSDGTKINTGIRELLSKEKITIYSWPSNPRLLIFHINERVFKRRFGIKIIGEPEPPFTNHKIDIVYFSNILLENMRNYEHNKKIEEEEENKRQQKNEDALLEII